MTRNGIHDSCDCHLLKGKPDQSENLKLLSSIPNQQIYRCCRCHAFLSYTEDRSSWEVMTQGNLEEEIKSLYNPSALQTSAI